MLEILKIYIFQYKDISAIITLLEKYTDTVSLRTVFT